MNWNDIKGRWKEFKGQARERWGRLTDDDLTRIEGEKDKLVGVLQQRYAKARDEVEKEVDEWCSRCST